MRHKVSVGAVNFAGIEGNAVLFSFGIDDLLGFFRRAGRSGCGCGGRCGCFLGLLGFLKKKKENVNEIRKYK